MNFETLLREHQLKATPQRVGILSVMQETRHISIEDLFSKIKKQYASISLATLYKNVNALLEVGIVREVKVPHLKSKYELTKEPHAHLFCEKCGEFKDIKLDLESIAKSAMSKSDYYTNENEVDVVISGICPACK